MLSCCEDVCFCDVRIVCLISDCESRCASLVIFSCDTWKGGAVYLQKMMFCLSWRTHKLGSWAVTELCRISFCSLKVYVNVAYHFLISPISGFVNFWLRLHSSFVCYSQMCHCKLIKFCLFVARANVLLFPTRVLLWQPLLKFYTTVHLLPVIWSGGTMIFMNRSFLPELHTVSL